MFDFSPCPFSPILSLSSCLSSIIVTTIIITIVVTAIVTRWAERMGELARVVPHVMFVLPSSPNHKQYGHPSWYDIASLGDDDPNDKGGIVRAADAVRDLAVSICTEKQIPFHRVVFAGFSQGGCVSLAAGLLSGGGDGKDIAATDSGSIEALRCAGVLSLSGYFGGRNAVAAKARAGCSAPLIVMLIGADDPYMSLASVDADVVALNKLIPGVVQRGTNTVVHKTYEGLQHTHSPEEMADAAKFLKMMLPPA
jgi:predicted esterase